MALMYRTASFTLVSSLTVLTSLDITSLTGMRCSSFTSCMIRSSPDRETTPMMVPSLVTGISLKPELIMISATSVTGDRTVMFCGLRSNVSALVSIETFLLLRRVP
ncbi:MAG: hypothetical protein A4E30_00501 [Methanomassiliicoccales archaeon PtaB.Bin215]|nr:MAG: hypothetical protein A4E30_00501 [Methanomassiliicoccales archaeon PtaB.Bin215]